MTFTEIQERCRNLCLSIHTDEFESSLKNLKILHLQQNNRLQDEENTIIKNNIKNAEKMLKNPKTQFYLQGDQTFYNAVHPDGKAYTKKELKKLNHLNKYWQIFLGKIPFYRCAYCGKPFKTDEIGKKKFCNGNHRKEHLMLNKKRIELGADLILWDTHNGKKPIVRDGARIFYHNNKLHSESTLKTKKSKWLKVNKEKLNKESETKEIRYL